MTTDGAWLPIADVLTDLSVEADSSDAPSVDRARMAAVSQIEKARPDLLVTVDDVTTFAPEPDVLLAGFLLTARLYARRASPTGLASYGEFGPAPVARFDPDVERLLGIGRYGKPRVR